MDCLFCKIINREAPADFIYEDDKVVAVKDIKPKAPIHFLIIPKKHINSVNEVKKEDRELMGDLILAAKNIAEEKDLEGYKLMINVGRKGGQLIDHMHMHLLYGFRN